MSHLVVFSHVYQTLCRKNRGTDVIVYRLYWHTTDFQCGLGKKNGELGQDCLHLRIEFGQIVTVTSLSTGPKSVCNLSCNDLRRDTYTFTPNLETVKHTNNLLHHHFLVYPKRLYLHYHHAQINITSPLSLIASPL